MSSSKPLLVDAHTESSRLLPISPHINTSHHHPHHHYSTSDSDTSSPHSILIAGDDDPNGEHSHTAAPASLFSPFWHRRSKFGATTIVVSTIILLILLFLVLAVLGGAIYEHFTSRHETMSLNIHLKLSQQCEDVAIQANKRVSQLDQKQQIDLTAHQQPHVTLYLTDFQERNYAVFSKLVEQLVQDEFVSKFDAHGNWLSGAEPCEVLCEASLMRNVSTYAMWPVENSECIQSMSDRIVQKISLYISDEAKTKVPDWINLLPEALKSEKIRMIHEYGSPNVFSQFSPHVTLAYDGDAKRLQDAFTEAGEDLVPSCKFVVEEIAFGEVGPWGTVLRGKDKENFKLVKQLEDKS